MQYLNSSAIQAVEYNVAGGNLIVWFTGGRHPYEYFGVPSTVYEGLLYASSKGEYFNRYIRDLYSVK